MDYGRRFQSSVLHPLLVLVVLNLSVFVFSSQGARETIPGECLTDCLTSVMQVLNHLRSGNISLSLCFGEQSEKVHLVD